MAVPVWTRVAELIAQAAQSGSKSSALSVLARPLFLLVTGAVAASWLKDATTSGWLLSGAGVIMVLYIVGFLRLLFKDPAMLRSEKFVIDKMTLERRGDSVAGDLTANSPLVVERARETTSLVTSKASEPSQEDMS